MSKKSRFLRSPRSRTRCARCRRRRPGSPGCAASWTAFSAASELRSPATGTLITASCCCGCGRRSDRPKRVVAGKVAGQRCDGRVDLRGAHGAVDDDVGRRHLADREVAVEDDESLLCAQAVGQRGDAGCAGVDLRARGSPRSAAAHRRRWRSGRGWRMTSSHRAAPRIPSGARPPGQRRPKSGIRPRFDAIAEQAQDRGQQRQGGHHVDQHDQDRARRQADEDLASARSASRPAPAPPSARRTAPPGWRCRPNARWPPRCPGRGARSSRYRETMNRE